MLKKYFRITWRNLLKHPKFAFLNLIGLSTALACTLLIILWINDELKVDKFNENDNQLYQVLQNYNNPQGIETTENTPGLLATALATESPEVAYSVPVIPASWFDKKGIITVGSDNIEATQQFVGKDYLNVFTYPLVQGNKETALLDKNSILISDELAIKLFHNNENVIGKTISWNQKDYSGSYLLSGVFKKPLPNATAQFDILFNYDLFFEKNLKLLNWRNNDPSTYLILKKGISVEAFNKKIAGFIKAKNDKSEQTLFIQKYSEKYLHNHYENGVPAGGRIEYVRLFSIIAIFILVIACINFMNLSTANAAARMKEAGIKKLVGASRLSLIAQYMGESMMMALLSALVAMILIMLLLPTFNQMTGKKMTLHIDVNLMLLLAAVILFTGVISGSYPALYLSRFKPVLTLKGPLKNSAGELFIRKGLVVTQFTLSVIFIISVMVIYKQMQLIQNKNLGYNREQVIYFDKGGMVSANKDDYAPGGKYESGLKNFIEQLKQVPGVINVSNFRHSIVNRNGGTSDLSWAGKDPSQNIDFTDLAAGYNFIETLGIEMKEGRTFSSSLNSEQSKIIFNELAIEKMGLKNPIGKMVHLWGADREIIGVTKNFNFQSLYENIKPCFFDLTFNQRASKIMVRLQSGQTGQAIARLEKLYKEFNPGSAFEFRFLNDEYNALYASERRVASLSKYFAGLAIIISCLGLFGLIAFTAQKRQKEISIRKVIGATAGNIIVLLSGDFLLLIVIALLIAFPVSWWLMNQWLNDFAYRISLGITNFLVAGGVTILITILTISLQAIKTATANPLKSLRSE